MRERFTSDGIHKVQQPLHELPWLVILTSWTILENSSFAFFNLSAGTTQCIDSPLPNGTVPLSWYGRVMLALDKHEIPTLYSVIEQSPNQWTVKSLLALDAWKGKVSRNSVTTILIQLYTNNVGFVWADNMGATVNVGPFNRLTLNKTYTLPYRMLRAVDTLFMFKQLRGVFALPNGDVHLGTFYRNMTLKSVVENAVPAGTTLVNYLSYDYWPNTWIDVVSTRTSNQFTGYNYLSIHDVSGGTVTTMNHSDLFGFGPFVGVGWVNVRD
eukprot:TRINITY_DN55687_c0_g1_i1.p1 TRINITY_DN55687_c0_g1~~TRINITY_DN55687_c0_g1_i1.p1  ORF type:complete len:269 (+),score=20.91 TRINITY_DN55687_c0_g1_i1:120-926(+)